MSLINEALKKAQKLRAQEQATVQPPTPGGGATPSAPIAKRRQPLSARTVVWSVFGAVSLIVFSIAFTILFLSGGDAPPAPATPPAAIARAPATPTAPTTAAPPAIIVTPEINTAADTKPVETPILTPAIGEPSPGPIVVAPIEPATPTPVAPIVALPEPTPPPDASATVAAPEAPPRPSATTPARPDPRIYALIDTLRISGIRASVTDPKVLMNDRLFRLNDIVDRASGLRIVKIEPSSLTFVDAAGAVYTKGF